MKVIDEFLSPFDFVPIAAEMKDQSFPWYYNDYICDVDDGLYQFTHLYYDIRRESQENSTFFYRMRPLIEKLGASNIQRIKANLNPRTVFHRNGGYYCDDFPCPTSAIYYINTNNGWTQFENGKKVKCVANRMVIFDSKLKHAGFSCTDEKRKIVINFNYA